MKINLQREVDLKKKKKTRRIRGKRNLLGEIPVPSEFMLLLIFIFTFKVTVGMPAIVS
jgi:hypothetical protein